MQTTGLFVARQGQLVRLGGNLETSDSRSCAGQRPIVCHFMRLCYKLGIAAVVFLLPCISAYPGELAILRNGFAIRYERREARNTVTRLYLTGATNDYVDVPTREIVRFQVEELDLPESPVPSLPPSDTLHEVISAASTRNKIVCEPAKQHIARGARDGAPHS